MQKAIFVAFKKLSSIEEHRNKWIIDDDVVRIIRHEYEVPDDKVFGTSHLNGAMSKDGRCSMGNNCLSNSNGFFRDDWTPNILPDGSCNSSTRKFYFVTNPGQVPPPDLNWYSSVQKVHLQDRHAELTQAEKNNFVKILKSKKADAPKPKGNTPGKITPPAPAAGEKRHVSPDKDIEGDPKRPRIQQVERQKLAMAVLDEMIAAVRELQEANLEPCVKLQTLAHAILRACGKDDDGLIALKCLDRSSKPRTYTNLYVEVQSTTKPRPSEPLENRKVPRAISSKTSTLSGIIDQYCGQKDAVLNHLAKKYGYVLVKPESFTFRPEQIIALREWVGMTGNGILRMDQFLRVQLPKEIQLFPTNLYKTMHTLEIKDDMDLSVQKVELYISKAEDKKRMCVYWCVKDPALPIEKLLVNCIMSGTFVESINISNSRKQVILPFGADRAKEEFTMLVRIGNRENGNAPRHCIAVAMYEHGSECRENMMITVFSDRYPLREFLQKLLDDKLTFIVVKVLDANGKVQQCACVLVQIADLQRDTGFIPSKLELELLDEEYQQPGMTPPTPPRSQPKVVHVPAHVRDDETLNLSVRLMRAATAGAPNQKQCYNGFQLLYQNCVVANIPWTTTDCVEKPNGSTVEVEALQAIGFPSHDTKQGLLICQGTTASSSCPCTTCMANSSNFDVLPEWMEAYKDEIREYLVKIGLDVNRQFVFGPDAAKREGEHSFEANHERYKEAMGNGQFHLSDGMLRKSRRENGSCIMPHLLDIHHHKDSLSGMHVTQGCMSHLCDNI